MGTQAGTQGAKQDWEVDTENPGDAEKTTTEGKTQASIHRSDQEKQTVAGSGN